MADLSKIVCLEQDCRHGTEQIGSSGSGNDTYTKAEIDSKDADIRAAASEAKSAANNAQSVNQTQDGQIKALQEAVDNLPNNIGTITGIKMNGVSKGTSGVVDLGTVITKHQDVSGKVNNTLDGANSLLSKITKVYTASITGNTYFIRKNPGGTNEFGLIKFSTLWEYIKTNIEFFGYTGTITGIKMNGASKGTSGVVDLGTVITAHQDISGKQDKSTAVTHTANTAVGSATKPVYIAANGAATPITHSINSDVPANAKFTDTTYSDATQSAHGLMTAADKKKLDGMDLTKYLPLSGGVMTGNIDLASNGVDLLVGTQRAVQGTYASAVAGATVAAKEPLKTGLPKRKSLIGSWLDQNSAWHSILSVRHRNGWNDGPSYGFYLRSLLTSNGDLCWNKQTGVDKWQGERVLLDSINYSSYAAPLSHTHRDIDQIGNVGYYGSDEADSNGWYKIYSGTLTGYADRVARLSIVRSYGKGHGIVLFHLRCNNNSSIIIHDLLWETRYKFDENHIAIKTNKNEYGIYVYQNSVQWGRIKVRVLESCGTSSNWTMTISNNSTKESSFTPTATGKDGSTVAKANEADTLTETAWTDVPETNISPRYGKNIKYLKSGNTVYVRGSISFSQSLNNPCCGTMPSDLLPDDYQDHVFTAWNLLGGVPTAYPVVLAKDGKITLMNPTSKAQWFEAGRAYNFNFNYHIG